MSLAVESDRLLQEIRDLRARQQRAFQRDLADIDRAYELQVEHVHQAAQRARIVHICVWTLTLLALIATLMAT